jgi:hypothetical protein
MDPTPNPADNGTLICPNCATAGRMPVVKHLQLKVSDCYFRQCPNCDFQWPTFEFRPRNRTSKKPAAAPAPAASRWFLIAAVIGSETDNCLRMLLSKDLRPTGTRYLDSQITPDAAEALLQLANDAGCAHRLQALLQSQLRVLFNSLEV